MAPAMVFSGGDVPEFEGKMTPTVVVCVIIAAFGGFLFGYDIGISGSVIFSHSIDIIWIGWFVTIELMILQEV